jgi:hypothetical protein
VNGLVTLEGLVANVHLAPLCPHTGKKVVLNHFYVFKKYAWLSFHKGIIVLKAKIASTTIALVLFHKLYALI